MNRYIFIRRLRGPAFLLLVGIIALLNQADVLSWGHAWPLFLILMGVLLLVERAALMGQPNPPYPGMPYAAGQSPAAGQTYAPAEPGTSIVPAQNDFDSRGGQQ
jgi:hypothetical protein